MLFIDPIRFDTTTIKKLDERDFWTIFLINRYMYLLTEKENEILAFVLSYNVNEEFFTEKSEAKKYLIKELKLPKISYYHFQKSLIKKGILIKIEDSVYKEYVLNSELKTIQKRIKNAIEKKMPIKLETMFKINENNKISLD